MKFILVKDIKEGGISNWIASGAQQAIHHAGNVVARNIAKGLPLVKKGIKKVVGFAAKKAAYGAGRAAAKLIKSFKGPNHNAATAESVQLIVVDSVSRFFEARRDKAFTPTIRKKMRAARKLNTGGDGFDHLQSIRKSITKFKPGRPYDFANAYLGRKHLLKKDHQEFLGLLKAAHAEKNKHRPLP